MQNIGKNIKKHTLVYALMLCTLAALLASFSAPAAAQAPTVTPLPGPVATMTKGAEVKRETDAQQAEADRLIQQGNDAKRIAEDRYNAAQDDVSNARALLAAQQYQQAGEALGRAEAGIEAGREQLTVIDGVRLRLSGIVETQAATITQQAGQITQLQDRLRDANTAYQAASLRLDEAEKQRANPVVIIAAGFLFVFLIGILIIFLIEKWRGDSAPRIVPQSEIVDDDEP